MTLYSLVYVSAARADFPDSALLDLLSVSRELNHRNGITGMLLFKERRFMQVLEGDKPDVRATFDRITRDPRHGDVTTLLEQEIAERDFPEWTMGFQSLDGDLSNVPEGYTAFLDVKFSVFDFGSDPSRAHQLLRIFRRM